MQVGEAYLVPSGPNNKKHLHVVIVDPDENGSCIWVNICSVQENVYYDESCEFVGGEHKFIKHHSYVAYNFMFYVHSVHVERMVRLNAFMKEEDLKPRFLQKILDGLYETIEAPKGVLADCKGRLKRMK